MARRPVQRVVVPFEGRHFLHKPGVFPVVVIAGDLAIVAFLAWRLWRRRAHHAPVAG